MRVHVYRNRPDDQRGPSEFHYCPACAGWYGVPHEDSHCRFDVVPQWSPSCACALCRSSRGLPIEGNFGFFTEALRWQPPISPRRTRSVLI